VGRAKLTRQAALATIGALALLAATAPSGGARVVAETKLSISKFLPLYHGKVRSAFDECEAGRKVFLFRKQPGPNEKIGVDRANGQGKWKVQFPGDPENGDKFYAKARNVEISSKGTGLSCARDKSRTVTFVGG
jgi:hypothetical protein